MRKNKDFLEEYPPMAFTPPLPHPYLNSEQAGHHHKQPNTEVRQAQGENEPISRIFPEFLLGEDGGEGEGVTNNRDEAEDEHDPHLGVRHVPVRVVRKEGTICNKTLLTPII